MIIVLSGIFVILCALILVAAIKNKESKKNDLFYNTASYLYLLIKRKWLDAGRDNSFLKTIFLQPQVKADLSALNPTLNKERLRTNYYIEKIKLFLIIVFLGDVLAIILSVSSDGKELIVQGEYIERNDYGGGDIQTELLVKSKEGGFSKRIKVDIKERGYTDEELTRMYEEALPQLEILILNGNASLDSISQNMNFPNFIAGYPFYLQWESDQLWKVNSQGEIQNNIQEENSINEEGEIVVIKCIFSYREWKREYDFPICIYPQKLEEQELWEQDLVKAMNQAEERSQYESNYFLPQEVRNEKIQWEEEKKDQGIWILILGFITGCAIFYMKDNDLHKKAIDKKCQMEAEYPLLVNRITLYLGAGMTIKNAWIKISLDYRKRKEEEGIHIFLYEEMLFTCYEMQTGVPEGEAYEKFSQRCESVLLTRLSTLLVQSLKKGNSALLSDLQKETSLAQEERRNFARKQGEEAGTKLLVPMMMMLGIVMIFILVPAFQSFGM